MRGKHYNTSQFAITQPVLDHTPAEPVYCTVFGCGKVLTLLESLAGNICFKHDKDDIPPSVGGGYSKHKTGKATLQP